MNIFGNKVKLRAVEFEDLQVLHRWANDPEIQKMLGGWHFPSNFEDQKKWFNGLNINSLNQRFVIETEDMGVIGTANIVDIDWKNRNAFHGMMLGDKNLRGKGYGVDTVMAVMRYCFDELCLNRLDGTMIEYNEASLKLYIGKCGWKEEGRQRNWYYREGRYWDRINVGVTAEDYKFFIEKNNYWSSKIK